MSKSFSFHLNDAATQINSSATANERQEKLTNKSLPLNGVNWIHTALWARIACCSIFNKTSARLFTLFTWRVETPLLNINSICVRFSLSLSFFLVLIPSVSLWLLLPECENIKTIECGNCVIERPAQKVISMRDMLKAFESEYKSFIFVAHFMQTDILTIHARDVHNEMCYHIEWAHFKGMWCKHKSKQIQYRYEELATFARTDCMRFLSKKRCYNIALNKW